MATATDDVVSASWGHIRRNLCAKGPRTTWWTWGRLGIKDWPHFWSWKRWFPSDNQIDSTLKSPINGGYGGLDGKSSKGGGLYFSKFENRMVYLWVKNSSFTSWRMGLGKPQETVKHGPKCSLLGTWHDSAMIEDPISCWNKASCLLFIRLGPLCYLILKSKVVHELWFQSDVGTKTDCCFFISCLSALSYLNRWGPLLLQSLNIPCCLKIKHQNANVYAICIPNLYHVKLPSFDHEFLCVVAEKIPSVFAFSADPTIFFCKTKS